MTVIVRSVRIAKSTNETTQKCSLLSWLYCTLIDAMLWRIGSRNDKTAVSGVQNNIGHRFQCNAQEVGGLSVVGMTLDAAHVASVAPLSNQGAPPLYCWNFKVYCWRVLLWGPDWALRYERPCELQYERSWMFEFSALTIKFTHFGSHFGSHFTTVSFFNSRKWTGKRLDRGHTEQQSW